MNDADATLLRQRNGQVRLGHRIHGRAHNRDIQGDAARQTRAGIHLGRDHITAGRLQQNIIKSQAFGNAVLDHRGVFSMIAYGDLEARGGGPPRSVKLSW